METAGGRALGCVTLYTVRGCPRCARARSRLGHLGLPVREVDLDQHSELKARVEELAGCPVMPQIYFNGFHVGSSDDLDKLPAHELEHLVQQVWEEPLPLDGLPLAGQHCHTGDAGSIVEANQLSEALRSTMSKLLSDHLSADGKERHLHLLSGATGPQKVAYRVLSRSLQFERYCGLAQNLQLIQPRHLSREGRLAFFINVYNALVIHGILRLGFPENTWQRYRFFNYVSYVIGGEVFTLQEIENGVLRGNRKGVAQLLKPFSQTDSRLQVALPDAEPLIHFGLNHGAKGSPPIQIYTAKGINRQLCAAAEAFLENDGGCKVDVVKGEVELSQIFKWYRVDFGDTDEKLLNWILNHMRESPKKSSLWSLMGSAKCKVSYMPFDWSTNSMD